MVGLPHGLLWGLTQLTGKDITPGWRYNTSLKASTMAEQALAMLKQALKGKGCCARTLAVQKNASVDIESDTEDFF